MSAAALRLHWFGLVMAVLLLTVMVAGLFNPAAGVQAETLNRLDVYFGTVAQGTFSGDNFTDQELQGGQSWLTYLMNTRDGSGAKASNVMLSLATSRQINSRIPLPGLQQRGSTMVTIGPPVYRWEVGDVPEYNPSEAVYQFGEQVGLNTGPVAYTPGFDIVRVIDRTVFESPGLQTIRVTVTPRQKYNSLRLAIYTRASSRTVTVKVVSPASDASKRIYVTPEGDTLFMEQGPIPVNTSYTFEAILRVTPGVPKVEFIPETDMQAVTVTPLGIVTAGTVSRVVPALGTWTWTAEGNYEWYTSDLVRKGLTLSGKTQELEPVPVTPIPTLTPVPPPPPTIKTNMQKVLLPGEVSKDPQVIGANLVLTALLLLVFYFAASLFNSTLKENYESIRRLARPTITKLRLRWLSGQVREGATARHSLRMFVILLVTAVINGVVEPRFGWSLEGLMVFLAMVVMATISTFSYNGVRVFVTQRWFHVPALIKAYPLAILLAVGSVLLSRLVGFKPGLIFGFVGAFTLLPPGTLDMRQRSIGILWGTLAVIIVSVSAFFLRQPLGRPQAGPEYWLDYTLSALVTGGILRLLLGMLPLAFLDGGTVAAWKKWVWAGLLAAIVYFFIHIVVGQNDKWLEAAKNIDIWILFGLALTGLALSIAFWVLFRYRARRREKGG